MFGICAICGKRHLRSKSLKKRQQSQIDIPKPYRTSEFSPCFIYRPFSTEPYSRQPGSTISWWVVMNVVWKKFCRTLAGFRTARGGNVAITFALATLPILGFVGAAVDYSRANSVKAAMQTALDSTALMLSKEAVFDTRRSVEDQRAEIFHLAVRKIGSQGHPGPP